MDYDDAISTANPCGYRRHPLRHSNRSARDLPRPAGTRLPQRRASGRPPPAPDDPSAAAVPPLVEVLVRGSQELRSEALEVFEVIGVVV